MFSPPPPPDAASDFYKTLGVPPTASLTDIKQAYRKLSFKYHPDRNKDPSSQSIFQTINEAYETLSDPSKRTQYDRRQAGASVGGFDDEDLQHMLNMMFGGGGGRGGVHVFEFGARPGGGGDFFHFGPPPPMAAGPPPPLVKPLVLTLEQCYTGCTLPVEIERVVQQYPMQTSEKETLYVDIPVGIDTNEYIVIRDKGHIVGDKTGDLKIVVQIAHHDHFQRNGLDLYYKNTISLKEALLGTTISFQHLNGKLYNITSAPEIIYSGMKKQIAGLGMLRPGHAITGNLWLEFAVVFPHSLSEAQRETLAHVL
jgi:curved DNA-binding protein